MANVLYMKGMNRMEFDDDLEENEDIWDDSKLNDAYDKALKLANLEVAKRVALATNSNGRKKDKSAETSEARPYQHKNNKQQKKTKVNKLQREDSEEEHSWKEGMACRVTYSYDGYDYEAVVITVLDEENCVIKYLGYENTEIVPIGSLQPSLGKQARKDQMMEALASKEEDDESTNSNYFDNECSDRQLMHENKKKPSTSKRYPARNKRAELGGGALFPNIPMPDMSSILREFSHMDMPAPPPPMLGMPGLQGPDDNQALSNMLVSWYMSGYYTGLYQGMKRSKIRQRDC